MHQKAKLDGTWSLTDNHDLSLKLKASKDSNSGDRIVISGQIKDVSKNSLLFEVSEHSDGQKIKTSVLALTGTWQADAHNRLIFKVKKKKSQHDILTFTNTWVLGKHHRIIYKYEKADLIHKKKQRRELRFKGYWNLTRDNRLYYELDSQNGSGFDFKLGTAIFEKNRIKYKIMVGPNAKQETLALKGTWRITPDLGLRFGVDYGDNAIKELSFGADIKLSDDDTILFKIKNGGMLKLSRSMPNNAHIYALLRVEGADYQLEGGLGFHW